MNTRGGGEDDEGEGSAGEVVLGGEPVGGKARTKARRTMKPRRAMKTSRRRTMKPRRATKTSRRRTMKVSRTTKTSRRRTLSGPR